MTLQDIDPLIAALMGGLAAAVLILLALLWRRGAAGGVAGIAGRLEQMAAGQAASQAALGERLQAQERALAGTIEERLAALADRVGQGLHQSSQEAGKSLADLRERLALIDAAQANILALSSQVGDLTNVLGNKQARGAFGETQLADIVQSALPAQSYEFQAQLGAKRVDCLLRLPNPPGPIAIDAKFPLEAWRALREARDESAIAEAKRQFAIAIRAHVRSIAEKYIVPGETADSALMFLPSEAVYAELHAGFPHLVDEAGRARVWIVSPTTLMATLTTIRSVLKDVRMREQAHLVQIKVVELSKDVERLDERVRNLRKHFEKANADIRDITISTDKIIDKAAQIGELEVAAGPAPATLVQPETVQTRLN